MCLVSAFRVRKAGFIPRRSDHILDQPQACSRVELLAYFLAAEHVLSFAHIRRFALCHLFSLMACLWPLHSQF